MKGERRERISSLSLFLSINNEWVMVHTHCHIHTHTHRLFTAARAIPVWCIWRQETNECVTGPNQSIMSEYELLKLQNRVEGKKKNVKNDDIKINRTWLHVSLSIYIYFVLYNKKNVSSLISLCIHVACVNKQTESKKEEKKGTRQREKKMFRNPIIERMCIKTNKTARTHVYSRCDKIKKLTDRERKKKHERKTKMSNELRFK